jgi:hypothetical protein
MRPAATTLLPPRLLTDVRLTPPARHTAPSLQHGEGKGDRFSVDYIFEAAEKKMRGTPATGVDEIAWLRAFLDARYKLLYSYGKNERASVKRIEIYQKLVDTGECAGLGWA